MRRASVDAVSLLALCGCGFMASTGDPLVEAHRAAAAEFPQNGLAAVRNTVAKGYEGIEFDVVLTQDLVPVISHDPWLDYRFCTGSDGSRLSGEESARVLIGDLTLDALTRDFVCGGLVESAMPGAAVIAEPLMTLAQLLEELRPSPQMLVHIDVKCEPGMTEGPEVFASQILDVWKSAALPNPWYVSANTTETVRAFEARSIEFAGGVPTSAVWPRFPVGADMNQVALMSELVATLGFTHLLAIIEDAGADGIAIPFQVADRAAIQSVRDAGYAVQLWTLNSRALLAEYCEWPLDGIITDMPGEAPCR